MKVTNILYHWFLLLDQFRFCETHCTTYQRFVGDQSAISPSSGGLVMRILSAGFFFGLKSTQLARQVQQEHTWREGTGTPY